MSNVVLTTTMWDEVGDAEGKEREELLKNDFWKDMMANGCKTERFENTYEDAWRIVGSLSQNSSAMTFLIQDEMGEGKTLDDTRVGKHIKTTTNKMSSVSFKTLMTKFRRFSWW